MHVLFPQSLLSMSALTSSPHNEPVAVTTVTNSAVTMSTNKTDFVQNQIIKLALIDSQRKCVQQAITDPGKFVNILL